MKPTYEDLLRHLAAILDGVTGYQCEHGNLRYWDQAAIENARKALASA